MCLFKPSQVNVINTEAYLVVFEPIINEMCVFHQQKRDQICFFSTNYEMKESFHLAVLQLLVKQIQDRLKLPDSEQHHRWAQQSLAVAVFLK